MLGIALMFLGGLVIAPITIVVLKSATPQAVANAFYLEFALASLVGGVLMGLTYRAKPGEKDDPGGGALAFLGIYFGLLLVLGASVIIAGWFGAPNTLGDNPFWSPLLGAGILSLVLYQLGYWPARAVRIARRGSQAA